MTEAATPQTPVIITGGGSGIGRAIALKLAAVSRPVAVWDIDLAAAQSVAEQCARTNAVEAVALEVDLLDSAALTAAVDETVARLGTVGGLVHSAGTVARAEDGVVDVDTWERVLRLNLTVAAELFDSLYPHLSATPGAAFVGISSIEGLLGLPGYPSYSASKHGLIGLVRSLAGVGPHVRANAVCPGFVDTPMLANVSPTRLEAMRASVPLNRLAHAEEIAAVVRFLLSDEASFINGAAIPVDGGFTAVGGQP